MEYTCPSCGKVHQSPVACPWCGAAVLSGSSTEEKITAPPDTKENKVIRAKIKTRRDQADAISQTGPILLFLFGAVVCITIIGILLGIILVGISIIWSNSRENEKKRLENEIKELEAELAI